MNKIIEKTKEAAEKLPVRKNWVRRIVYTALAILIVAVGLQVYTSYWLAHGGKDRIFEALSSAAGMDITSGGIRIGFGRLIARDIGLSANGKTFAEINELAIKPDYAKLLRRQIAIGVIDAKGVNLTLRRDKNGDFGLPWGNETVEKDAENDVNSEENSKNIEKDTEKEKKSPQNDENNEENGINTTENTEKKPKETKPPELPFRHLHLEQVSGTYYDEQKDISMSFHSGILRIRDFSQERPFRAMLAAKIRGKYKKFDIPETEISVKSRLSGPSRGGEGKAEITRGKTSAELSFYVPPAEKRQEIRPKIEFSAEDLENLIPDKEIIKRYGLENTDIKFTALFSHEKIRAEKFFLSSGKTKISADGDFFFKKEKGVYPLILENLEISGLRSSYRKYKDGTDNTPEITSFIHWFFSTPSAVDFRMKKAVLKDIDLEYADESDAERYYLDDLNLVLTDYASSGKFSLSLETRGGLESPWYSQKALGLSIKGSADLKNFEMSKAYTDAEITVYTEGIPLSIKGNCKNFINPQGRVTVKTAKGASALPDFVKKFWDTKKYQAEADISFDIAKKRADLIQGTAEGMGSNLSLKGFYSWAGRHDYEAHIKGNLDLGRLGNDIPAAKDYMLAGKTKADIYFSPRKTEISADIGNGGFKQKNLGIFTGINTKIWVRPFKEISISTFTAKLNDSPFTMGFSLTQKDSIANVGILLKADKMVISKSEKTNTAKEVPVSTETEKSDGEEGFLDKWLDSMQTINLNTEIAVRHFDSEFFETYGLLLKANASGLDDDMKNVNGNALISTTLGGIKVEKDKIYNIKNSYELILRAITTFDRVLGVWQVVYKVKDMVSSKEKKAQAKALRKAQAAYPLPVERFFADVDIRNGLASINDFYLTSEQFSFKATGNISLPEKNLDLTVRAAADKAPPDGVLPIKLKITGPFDDIDTRLGKTSTITSIVVQPFTNRGPIGFLKKKLGITKKENTRDKEYFKQEY